MDNVNNIDDAQLKMKDLLTGQGEASGEAPRKAAPAPCPSPVRLRTPERRQMEMVPRCLDDLVSPEHPVRRVAQVAEHLDMAAFYQTIKAREGVPGRDATDPKLLVTLWLYACIRGIGSAHELARQCQENLAFLWLLGGVTVNHRLLSDFRSVGGSALDQLFTQVVASLVDQGVVKVSRISQDGVRVRVGAGASSFRREERLEKLLEEAQQHVRELREELDSPAVRAKLTARQRAARQRAGREKQERRERA